MAYWRCCCSGRRFGRYEFGDTGYALDFGGFVAGGVVMRAAGCVVNDYADRKFDGHVKRTDPTGLYPAAP